MDFDNSKENIQPLRGGRNPAQLGVALQAQNSADFQRELVQQKQEFENAICNYVGDDPLENYYNYISWVEQSFPKHGHEGNLVPLLESCLKKFEDDKRYANDRRLCKLWIKFIDYQQNPIELYHMLHAKGICRGCSDFYRAWAFYHEVVGDYKSADMVFNLGLREMAQPYEELLAAHQSMIFAAGQQVINGINEERLQEQRNALTMLRMYKPGRVSSVRHLAGGTPVTIPGRSSQAPNSNRIFNVYEENNDQLLDEAAAPTSVIEIARRGVGTKENLMKAGVWTTAIVGKSQPVHRMPSFSIHEDCYSVHWKGLQLPPSFVPVTNEIYTTFNPLLVYMEPEDPKKIAKYPKKIVYSEKDKEYSIEEIKATSYLCPPKLKEPEGIMVEEPALIINQNEPNLNINTSTGNFRFSIANDILSKQYIEQEILISQHKVPITETSGSNFSQNHHLLDTSVQAYGIPVVNEELPSPFVNHSHLKLDSSNQDFRYSIANAIVTQPTYIETEVSAPQEIPNNVNLLSNVQQNSLKIVDLWTSRESHEGNASENTSPIKKNMANFEIYDDCNIHEQPTQPKGTAMKTPLKTLSADDLVETGSRGGLDIAMAAQPVDSARNVLNLDDQDFDTPDTQIFNFNLNMMKVSTPKQQNLGMGVNMEADSIKKQPFGEHKKTLSTIFEETKSYGSSGSSGSSGLKSTLLPSRKLYTQEQSTYHINLAQNLKANAALRSSLLGNFIDYIPEQHTPTMESQPLVPPVVSPTTITPLMSAPDDPFQASLIETLLERINFPGQHIYGFIKISNVPRLNVKKEVVDIGREKYYVEKMIGRGGFGSVYKAEDCQTRQWVAVKFQRPANRWEYYICRELQARLADSHMKERFMAIHRGYFNDQVSILVSDFNPNGSLLDIANKLKQQTGRPMKESLCMHFCIEMLEIISAMHSAKVIHADIKPDNFLVQLVDNNIKLHLIDFGCSIDMAMFPPGTTFLRKVTTEDFTCCEMLDGRPWSYHTDLFCVAASAHVLLFDKYIQMQKKDDHWSIKQRFLRYYRVDCWNMFFSALLNQQNGPAKIEPLMQMLSGALDMSATDFQSDMRFLVNMLRGR